MTDKTYGELTPEEQTEIQSKAMLAGTARGLDLYKRMASLFTERHWPHSQDFLHFAMTAVCFTALGAGGTRLKTPKQAAMLGGKWAELADLLDHAPPAGMIVDHLELEDLLVRA